MIYSQKEGTIWYFGNHAGLDFNSGIPVPLTNGQINANEGTASIADSSGQLLFYTDGITIWNRNHLMMPNGTGLMGNSSSSQAALIVPKPGSSNIYYVFTSDENANADGFRYSEVDMTLEGGKGDVTTVKNVLLATPTCEKITAVKKTDGSGYWILTHSFQNSNFLAFSITNLGINTTPVVSSVGLPVNEAVQTVGHLKVSPDGTKIVSCSFKQRLELFDFNAETGIVSNPKILNNKKSNYGAEFSPLGNVLYVTTGNDSYIFDLVQYDLTASNIASTEINIKTNIQYQFGALQLGPDGKIYISTTNSNYISFIDQPEIIGNGCNFIKNGVFLGSGVCTFGLPQFVQSYFNLSSVVQYVCYGGTINFSLPTELDITSALWDFGDGNTSTQITTTHNYELPGFYDANVTAEGNTGLIHKKWQIIISEVPVANRIPNQIACGGTNTVYNLKKNNTIILGIQNPDTFRVDYFLSLENANSNVNSLSENYNLPLGTTHFYAKIYNVVNIQCSEVTSFEVTLIDQLSTGQVSNFTICQNQPANYTEQFNLLAKNQEVLNGLDDALFAITYHNSQEDADNDTAALPDVYTNIFPEETIYVRLENKSDSTCFATTSFIIRVIEQPVIGIISPFLECEESSGNGTAVFDLVQKTSEILGTLSPDVFTVSYYTSQWDATNGNNPITAPYVNTTNNQTIYAVVKAIGASCKTIGSFHLIVTTKPIKKPARDIQICDDATNDGKEIFSFANQTVILLEEQFPGQFNISYHLSNADAQNDMNPLALNYENISNPQTIYIRTESILNPNCYEVSHFEIEVDAIPQATKPATLNLCSTEIEGFTAEVDLHQQDAVILNGQSETEFSVSYYASLEDAIAEGNSLASNYQNTVSPQQIFARVNNINNPKCFAITDFEIMVFSKPLLEMKEIYSFCQNSSIQINAPAGFDGYYWSTGATTSSINVENPMDINLTVTKNYGAISCDNAVSFSVVESSIAIIKEVEIKDWTENQNSIHIIAIGDGDYEYSIDGETYQDSAYFYGLEMGQYTVYVRDKNECGIVTKQIYLLIYPKYFTPNGDDYNEKWQIKFAASEPNLEVSIFDKYGKLLASFDGKSDGWDGKSNNVAVPSADYWFVVKRKNGVAYKGHFALLR